jgi:hypothetical protein
MRIKHARPLSSLLIALLAMPLVLPSRAAARFDPGSGRMGFSDRSTLSGFQARVWVVTVDGQLMFKAVDQREDAWRLVNVTGAGPNVDAVSFTDGAVQRERAFFVRNGVMNEATYTPEIGERIAAMLADFKLATTATELVPRLLAAGEESALVLLREVLELEAQGRMERRVERLMRASKLPLGKTLDALDRARVPKGVMRRVDELARGDFLARAENVLVFGKPGVGKSHIACALGHALVERGHSVFFAPTYQLVQTLLAARRDLALPRALRQLDAFDLVILDDIGYSCSHQGNQQYVLCHRPDGNSRLLWVRACVLLLHRERSCEPGRDDEHGLLVE